MAYGYYPQVYPQYPQYPQYQQPQQQQVQQPTDSRIWVQGEVGAKAYLCAPNNVVTLWDTERPVIYLKSVNASGMPSMQVLSYSFDVPATTTPNTDYVTRSEFDKAISELKGAFKNVEQPVANDSAV